MADYLFTLKDSPELRARLIGLIPPDWKVMRGSLFPALGEKDRKLTFSFEGKPEPTTTLRLDISEKGQEHIQRIVCSGPPALGFIEVMNQPELYRTIALKSARTAALHILGEGYGGVLDFAQEMITGDRTPAICTMIFDFNPPETKKSPQLTVRIAIDEGMGGNEEDLKPLLKVCRST